MSRYRKGADQVSEISGRDIDIPASIAAHPAQQEFEDRFGTTGNSGWAK